MSDDGGYSIENATRFAWSSVSGELNPGRTALLDRDVVGRRVLDAGCGGGGYSHYLFQKGYDVVGVDLHNAFLDLARQKLPHIDFQSADVTDLPFEDRSFDTVFCFDVLEHIDDQTALAELIRVASKRVLIAVPREGDEMLPYNLTFSTYRDTTHRRYYSEASLRKLIQSVLPANEPVIRPELMLPVNRLLPHLCDTVACGYLGIGGLPLRAIRAAGLPCNRIAEWRGRRSLDRIASHAANEIPTGLTATIELS